MGYQSNVTYQTATIANGQTTSNAVEISGTSICYIETPSLLTSTTFTFLVSHDGVTYVELRDYSNTAFSMTVTTSKGYYIDPSIFAGVLFVKLVGGSSEGGARSIILGVRPV